MSKESKPPEVPRLPSFSTYDIWEGTEAECLDCGWRGKLSEDHKHLESDHLEILCPGCSEPVAYIWFPNEAEARAAGDESTVKMFDAMKAHTNRFEFTCLKSPDQLPEINEDEIYITWDTVEEGLGYTCFKHNDVELFREPCIFESGWRYREVATIFREKYGKRLIDIIPTWGGWLYLGGDSFHSLAEAKIARKEFFGRAESRANA